MIRYQTCPRSHIESISVTLDVGAIPRAVSLGDQADLDHLLERSAVSVECLSRHTSGTERYPLVRAQQGTVALQQSLDRQWGVQLVPGLSLGHYSGVPNRASILSKRSCPLW